MPLSTVLQDVLAQRVVTRHLLAVSQMDFFHGTGFQNLRKIAKKGLVANSGAIWGGGTALVKGRKAVYLTSDFELAARYGQGASRSYLPVVLEVRITTPRRFRNLRYDPLDRHENAWEVEDSYEETTEEAHRDIEAGIKTIASKLGFDIYPRYDALPAELEAMDGINVFKLIAGYLTQQLGLTGFQRKLAIQQAQAMFAGREWDYLEVRRDGTLKLTEEYFYTREQLMYMKGLPPASIKGVWVRLLDFDVPESQIKETKNSGFKELPGESAGRFESLKDLIGKLRWTTPDEMDDLEDWARQARDMDYPELADYLQEIAGMDPESRSEIDDWDTMLEDLEIGLHDEWMVERVHDQGLWAKVPLQVATKLQPRDKGDG